MKAGTLHQSDVQALDERIRADPAGCGQGHQVAVPPLFRRQSQRAGGRPAERGDALLEEVWLLAEDVRDEQRHFSLQARQRSVVFLPDREAGCIPGCGKTDSRLSGPPTAPASTASRGSVRPAPPTYATR